MLAVGSLVEMQRFKTTDCFHSAVKIKAAEMNSLWVKLWTNCEQILSPFQAVPPLHSPPPAPPPAGLEAEPVSVVWDGGAGGAALWWWIDKAQVSGWWQDNILFFLSLKGCQSVVPIMHLY